MGDLFIKERLPDGTLGEKVPAFDGGQTEAEKIASLKASDDSILLAILGLYEVKQEGGV